MNLKRTPFYQYHLNHKGKMVEFAGWEMPILYESILDEHRRVREEAGVFDVSHMGRLYFKGKDARRLLERICTRRVSDMKEGTCRYSLVCNERGGVHDDVIVYRMEDQWLMVVNASNRAKIVEHIHRTKGDMSVEVDDRTEKTGMIALQGPAVMEVVSRFSSQIPALKRYSFTVKNLIVVKLIVSRTGYTGEDGVEIILPANMVGMALKVLLQADDQGEDRIKPCGLGARDTLRMEAAMPLYGHELSEDIDPISAGLSFAVALDKDQTDEWGDGGCIGLPALKQIAAEGPKRRLVGLRMDGKRTARQGMDVKNGDKVVGQITSGCLSPTLGYPIAMAYVQSDCTEPGQELAIDLGKTSLEAQVVKLPFYKKK